MDRGIGDGVICFQLGSLDSATLAAIPGRECPDVKAANIVKAALQRWRRKSDRRTRARQMLAAARGR